ncbi:MAG: methyltransferase domain-containing protein [Candidatus Aegiribacteria sp.]|nr:methyltransferase domain-containing protein [Candidatus Aegiribacteria sp.]
MKTEIHLWERYGPLFSLEERDVYPPDMKEIQFYIDLRKKYPGKCMELGAGDGRLTELLPDGSQVIALEPSASMLGSWSSEKRKKISRIRAIAQNIPLRNSTLDLVLFPYNGIHCILERNERKLVFREIAAVLKPGGKFFAEACPGFDNRQDEDRKVRYDYNRNGSSVKLVESVSHDFSRGLIVFDMEYSGSAVADGRIDITLELALISAGELLNDIRNEGMRVAAIWGDYDLSPWASDDSPRLLVLAERNKK